MTDPGSLHRNVASVWLSKTLIAEKDFLNYLGPFPTPYRFTGRDWQKNGGAEALANSKFESDYSIDYDDGFAETAFSKVLISIPKLMEQCPLVHSDIAKIELVAQKKKIIQSNAAIILPDFGFDREGADAQVNAVRISTEVNRKAILKFLGSFDFQETETIKNTEPIPMRRKKVLMEKYDPLADKTHTYGVERMGSEIKTYSGVLMEKLEVKEFSFESPKSANLDMNKVVNARVSEGFSIIDVRDWKYNITQFL